MKPNEAYAWELELVDGSIVSQLGGERWQDVDPGKVLRVSLVPRAGLPRHDVYCHAGNQFVRRFGRGFLKQSRGFHLAEYAQCIQTEQFRIYILADGRTIVMPPDFELYL